MEDEIIQPMPLVRIMERLRRHRVALTAMPSEYQKEYRKKLNYQRQLEFRKSMPFYNRWQQFNKSLAKFGIPKIEYDTYLEYYPSFQKGKTGKVISLWSYEFLKYKAQHHDVTPAQFNQIHGIEI